jgi:hypothetical protein
MRRLVPLVAAALLCAAVPADAKLRVGVSEQNANVFSNRYFTPLKIRYARIVGPWNITTRRDYWPAYLQAWLDGAKRTHVEPHVAFNIAGIEKRYFGKGPTVAQYRRMFKQFRKRWPQVKVFTPWNEANHKFQPTAKRPRLAYRYNRVLNAVCPQCTVLAADVYDTPDLPAWLARYKRLYRGAGPWGIHNYQDANARQLISRSWTLWLARHVRGPLWSTEAGGIVGYQNLDGRTYPYSLSRQLRAQRHLFKLLRHPLVRRRYQRVYLYSWFGTWGPHGKRTNRWDSGLLNLNGTPRPAYWDLKRRLSIG